MRGLLQLSDSDHSMHTGDYSWGSDMLMTCKSVHNYYYKDFKGTVGVINRQECGNIPEKLLTDFILSNISNACI